MSPGDGVGRALILHGHRRALGLSGGHGGIRGCNTLTGIGLTLLGTTVPGACLRGGTAPLRARDTWRGGPPH
ncbi:hypothetical protein Taro_028725 [Colocasia esculenta]|uniref:Uncharacterized protein n=1 Tax=Colocasia esculenta TaxID=4460 RepID=A0A843VH58_COLES|nr:hypothetical protein [Colocasia esculenta]